MKRVFLIPTMIFLVLGLCDAGWGEKPLVVVGQSEQGEEVPNPSLEMAIQDGWTRAVEEVVKGMVAPRDIKERQETLSQEFYQKADAFILSYKILERTALPTGYQVLLECVVDTKGIEGRLASLGLLQEKEQGPRLREVRVVVSGIRSYQTYLQIERLLREDTEVQAVALSEIGPTVFTWEVMLKGETGRLAGRIVSSDFGGLKARVFAVGAERLEIVLSQ
jgi:hypothetical protein